LCCEPEVAADQDAIDYRINATATLLEGMLRVGYAWREQLAKSWGAEAVQNAVRIPVPVAQGWSIDEYRRSIGLMLDVWERWLPWVAAPVLIGLGSVCRRHLTDPRNGLFAILEGIEGHLPKGARLHLSGVKGQALSRVKMYDWLGSVDSMAADYATHKKARQAEISNTIAHRAAEMNRWMAVASRRVVPAIGDRFRLAFKA
jgi:hypothetical protein